MINEMGRRRRQSSGFSSSSMSPDVRSGRSSPFKSGVKRKNSSMYDFLDPKVYLDAVN